MTSRVTAPISPQRTSRWALLGLALVGLAATAALAVAPLLGWTTAVLVWVGAAVVIVVVAGVLQPQVGVAVLVGLAFTNLAAFSGSENLLPAGLAALFGAAALARRDRGRPDALIPFLAVAGLYAAYSLLSMLWSGSPLDARSAAVDLGFTIILAAGVVACVTRARDLTWASWTIIGVGVGLGLLALRQFVTGDYSWTAFGLAQADYQQISGADHAFRAGGPVADANFFGQIMVVVLALSLERLRGAATTGARLTGGAAAAVALGTIAVTYSRGALLAAAVVLVLAIMRLRHRVLILALGAAAVTALFAVGPANYGERIAQVPSAVGLGDRGAPIDPAISGRTSSWLVAERMLMDQPLVGVGYGQYHLEYLNYAEHIGRDWRGEPRAPHSLPLQILAEQGVIGFALMGAVVAGAFVSLRRARRALAVHPGGTSHASLLSGLSDALIGYLVAGLFLHSAHPSVLWVLLALGWAAIQTVPAGPLADVMRLDRTALVHH